MEYCWKMIFVIALSLTQNDYSIQIKAVLEKILDKHRKYPIFRETKHFLYIYQLLQFFVLSDSLLLVLPPRAGNMDVPPVDAERR